jgi:gliding motility-associated-like protein
MRLTVIVPRIIFIPTVFSPNGDGLNDYFTISGRRNLVNIAVLKIYDRWGNQLFEGKDLEPGNESEGWDGMFRGEPMQPGVYVYAAELTYDDGVTEAVTGDITVLR